MNNNRSLNENNPFNSKDENDLDEIDFSSYSQDKLIKVLHMYLTATIQN